MVVSSSLCRALLLVALCFSCSRAYVDSLPPPPFKLLGQFHAKDAAFTTLLDFGGNDSTEALIITGLAVNPLVPGYVYSIPNVSQALDGPIEAIEPTLVTEKVVWPNKVSALEYSQFDRQVMAVAGGFLIPGHSTGEIALLHREQEGDRWSAPHKISKDKFEWFYHIPYPLDVNGDGHVDILTARAIKPILSGQPRGELMWLENPGDAGDALGGSAWREHVLFPGPDLIFTVHDVDGDGVDEVIAAEFFSKKVTVYWNWTDPSARRSTVLEDTYAPFWVGFYDLNGDGRDELLVTSHEANASQACVYVYIVPEAPATQVWEKHTLACGFQIVSESPGNAAPGQAIPIKPHRYQDGKPVILLSADNANKAYVLSPNSTDPNNWDYTTTLVWDAKGDIGEIAVGYFGGETAKFLIPDYTQGIVNVYTF